MVLAIQVQQRACFHAVMIPMCSVGSRQQPEPFLPDGIPVWVPWLLPFWRNPRRPFHGFFTAVGVSFCDDSGSAVRCGSICTC